ncbi:MAG TPA: nuclease, partial [Firmicutes bacterium]|nr:nuclease [Bacillota bacterium]
GNRGVPDRVVLLPGGRTVYVETKAPGKPLEPLQKKWAKDLRDLGHKVYKIDTLMDIDKFIAECKGGGAQ